MYELLAYLALFSTYLVLRFLQKDQSEAGFAIAYVAVTAAGLYTHYFYPVVLLMQAVIFLGWFLRRHSNRIGSSKADQSKLSIDGSSDNKRTGAWHAWWEDLWKLAVAMGVSLLLYLPWMPVFFRQIGGRSADRPGPLSFLVDTFSWAAFGPTHDMEIELLPLLAFGLLVIVGLVIGWIRAKRYLAVSLNLLWLVLIPLMMMWLLGATKPAYFKFLLVIVPPISVLAGVGWWSGWVWLTRRLPAALVGVTWSLPGLLLLFGVYQALFSMYYDPVYYRDDYRSVARLVEENNPGDTAVILNAANQWEVFTYYHRDGAPVFPLPQGIPDPAIIDAKLSDIINKYDRIYVLFWGESERDPERLVESWLDENTYKTSEEWVGDVRLATYASPLEGNQTIVIEPEAIFGDTIRLLSYSLSDLQPSPGDIIQITLTWQTQAPITRRYKVFIHLLDSGQDIVAQRDSEPGGGMAPTLTWQPNLEIIDNHGLLLPRDLPPGQYELLLGLYDFEDPVLRLPVETEGMSGDALPLGNITVQNP